MFALVGSEPVKLHMGRESGFPNQINLVAQTF